MAGEHFSQNIPELTKATDQALKNMSAQGRK